MQALHTPDVFSTRPRLPYSGRTAVHAHPAGAGAVVDVHALAVGYRPGQPDAVRGVSLRIGAGLRVALVGANGAGKSTLLKAIAGLVRPRAGSVSVFGGPIASMRHRIVYLPQRGEIDWRFPVTVSDLVMAGRYVHLGWLRRPAAADRAIVSAVLERMNLLPLADRQIGELSGGQQQRALLARALAQQGDLLLLDEPLTAIDAETRAAIGDIVRACAAEGKTVIAATHQLDTLADDYDVAYHLAEGALVRTEQFCACPA